jgi:putative membrane-bound dehydrogenase-like protein
MNRAAILLFVACLIFIQRSSAAEPASANKQSNIKPPRVLLPGWTIDRVAAEPQLVTPTDCCIDDAGRLLVIECHTHFPPEKYAGPLADRIYRFTTDAASGTLGNQQLFYEGGQATMGIANLGDGWIGLLSRSELRRVRDSDGDNVADQSEILLRFETTANYPHNGLVSLAVGGDGWLTVGQGENFGESYQLIGADGSKQVGSGEGGNLFRCRPDGSQVQRLATGFWNPFGLCYDPAGRLWVVGNDPDSMPPNRLMHVVPTADFGFQFRFGRAGTHPLQAWNGELPGTLPMAAAIGEAACDVVVHGKYLYVSSWGDNRIERYELKPRGASFESRAEVVVQGDANFRPVGLAVASDGSLYITDWVDRNYSVHLKGRLWRLVESSENPNTESFPILSESEQLAARLLADESTTLNERLTALDSDDPYVRQAAIAGLIRSQQLDQIARDNQLSAKQAAGVLTAWRWIARTTPDDVTIKSQLTEWLDWGLRQTDEQVVLSAIRYATEIAAKQHLPAIETLLARTELPPRVFAAAVASLAYLETGSAAGSMRDPATEKKLLEIIRDSKRGAALRAMAVAQLSEQATEPSGEQLAQWVMELNSREFSLAAVRLLAARETDQAGDALATLASAETLDVPSRADALAGLSRTAGRHASIINRLSRPRQPETLQREAKLILNQAIYEKNPNLPAKEDFGAWDELVGQGGDVDAGRRVFMRKTCVNCHAHSGRGARTGPDLTSLSGHMTSRRVLESILTPSREIGPLYVPWKILTVDGQVLTGLKLHAPGIGTALRFQGADGNHFEVKLSDIEDQEPVQQSIMPAGLEQSMSVQELRDLIAFLVGEAG